MLVYPYTFHVNTLGAGLYIIYVYKLVCIHIYIYRNIDIAASCLLNHITVRTGNSIKPIKYRCSCKMYYKTFVIFNSEYKIFTN